MTPIQSAFSNLPTELTQKQVQPYLNKIADLLPKTVYIAKKIHKQELQDLREKEIKNSMFPEIGENLLSGKIRYRIKKIRVLFLRKPQAKIKRSVQ